MSSSDRQAIGAMDLLAQDIRFNDVRATLQALSALFAQSFLCDPETGHFLH
jgi:methylmalonyl-CoA mutase N-terminal domain/subunit